MFPASHVSLFGSVWPESGSPEDKNLHKTTALPKGNPVHFKQNYQRILTFAGIVYTICQSTADSIINAKYKNFDALVKNFGCQMTALDVQQKCKNKDLHREARRVHEQCTVRFQEIAAMFEKPKPGLSQMTMRDYIASINLDLIISQDFADLVNFRLLHVIHDVRVEGQEEVPITNVDRLELIKNSLDCRSSGKIVSLDTWVHAMQAKESRKAVYFVQKLAAGLLHERASFLQRMVSQTHVREGRFGNKCSSIVAPPQSYSTEVIMLSIKGILVVKTKTTIGAKKIDHARDDRVFMHMPEQRILHEDEIAKLNPHKAIVVLEGFSTSSSLEKTIAEIGIHTLMSANLARIPQYTTCFCQDPLQDEEAELDISQAAQFDVVTLFRADHIYASSVQEERDYATHSK